MVPKSLSLVDHASKKGKVEVELLILGVVLVLGGLKRGHQIFCMADEVKGIPSG